MPDNKNMYQNPLITRYAGAEMSAVWSPQEKFSTWRRLWLALARAEKELGLSISDAQLAEMEAHLDDIDFDLVRQKEKELRHDVMSHIHAFGAVCPAARPIIHLGATSCYVTDNTDLVLLRKSLGLVCNKTVSLIAVMREFAHAHRALPTLGYTHYQPAQLTTVGKRCTLWLHDVMTDFDDLERQYTAMPFRGVKGTTGTQASFLELFDGDHEKVRQLDRRVTEVMGFDRSVPVCGQTYSRKIDFRILSVLSGIAQSLYKMAGDIRLLMNLKAVDEPFETSQVGSSAMAYKRNPMRSERICSLARYVISLADNAAQTHANQWFERTLDDSANRRIVLPESFLAVDAILTLAHNVIGGLTVWPHVIRKHVDAELPFMATENILMSAVKAGGDRQELHEKIRVHSVAAGRRVKEEGAENDLLERIAADPGFTAVHDTLGDILDPALYVGRAPQQVDDFLTDHVDPLLAQYGERRSTADEINV